MSLAAEQPVLRELLRAHAADFAERFGPGPRPRVFFAPGRVNLAGAHLDYNGGPVLPMAIDRGTFVALRPRADRRLTLASTVESGDCEVDLRRSPSRTGTWADYPLGVAAELVRASGPQCGADLLYGGNLPIGGGLSSSASICVATAFALDRVWELGRETLDLVHAALRAEREFVGVQCGIMDPYAIGFARPGHLLWLDCKDASYAHLPVDPAALCIGVADSGVRRDLARGDFNARVEQCAAVFARLKSLAPQAQCLRDVPAAVLNDARAQLDALHARRARHVLSEVERTFAMRAALEAGDLAEFGRLMAQTHASLRDDYEVSTPELDCLVESALERPGVYGARLTGAGFGGCCVLVLAPGARAGLAEHVQARFEQRFGRRPRVDFFQGDRGPREIEL